MTNLDVAILRLIQQRRRLEDNQGRIARRNARCAVLGAVKRIRLAINREYPRVVRPLVLAAKLATKRRKKRFRLPFSRAWDWQTAKLFARIADAVTTVGKARGELILSMHESAALQATVGANYAWLNPKWSSRIKWTELCACYAGVCGYVDQQGEIASLWKRFWSEPIITEDLRLSARHLEFIEHRKAGKWLEK